LPANYRTVLAIGFNKAAAATAAANKSKKTIKKATLNYLKK
jgi:hypothetical protein